MSSELDDCIMLIEVHIYIRPPSPGKPRPRGQCRHWWSDRQGRHKRETLNNLKHCLGGPLLSRTKPHIGDGPEA
jgi:hypothetical protein